WKRPHGSRSRRAGVSVSMMDGEDGAMGIGRSARGPHDCERRRSGSHSNRNAVSLVPWFARTGSAAAKPSAHTAFEKRFLVLLRGRQDVDQLSDAAAGARPTGAQQRLVIGDPGCGFRQFLTARTGADDFGHRAIIEATKHRDDIVPSQRRHGDLLWWGRSPSWRSPLVGEIAVAAISVNGHRAPAVVADARPFWGQRRCQNPGSDWADASRGSGVWIVCRCGLNAPFLPWIGPQILTTAHL